MSFSKQLRQEADPIFEAIFEHPFVRGIATGNLKKEQLIHYVKQDFEYLNSFMQIYGTAISKCENREDMQMFNEQISFVLHSEIHPHNNFCEVAGVTYEELQGFPLSPSAHHYIRHMLTVAQTGGIADILAVLLPCPWTYAEIGKRLLEKVKPDPSHPFYDWIVFYGGGSMGITSTFCKRLDELAESLNEKKKQKLLEYFLISCHMEYKFWDMAYTIEEWPVKLEVKAK